MDSILFTDKVNKLIDEAKLMDVHISEKTICENFIKSLPPSLSSILHLYVHTPKPMTLSEVLFQVEKIQPYLSNLETKSPNGRTVEKTAVKHHQHSTTIDKKKFPTAKKVHYLKNTSTLSSHEQLRPASSESLDADDYLIIDSGAEITVVKDETLLQNIHPNTKHVLYGAGNQKLSAPVSGTLQFTFTKIKDIKYIAWYLRK
ncbi:hypothetical protein TPHA_0P01170 [Tetrapisispora phaffii CBS 4417]|uniref:Uncharacterized protein n=1 Tax=Tetrapisispora phaffii (strain ATCC 24235 / CBS 4417 / NBRC 1672 / NRRL Y-8282 / UCD 70-5) TaxID=1071381 RepID=G8C297_TETPH|nr:hypothetical protein TPHA_0P01170 [Tetrapisispora phaffii CBS 4417]CCE66275.1 hypothetical protein TPHA_0P01170 [Tetrapisispora phaffii CBS 4417]